MGTFTIQHNNANVEIEQLDKNHFKAHLPDKSIGILLKQDNEGANHWFEEGTDNETDESRKIGIAIETWLAKKS